jgi:hypothetical protein
MTTTHDRAAVLAQFGKEYETIYDSPVYIAGTREAVQWFDANAGNPDVQPILRALVEDRQDFISSDREAAAFTFALDALGLIRED